MYKSVFFLIFLWCAVSSLGQQFGPEFKFLENYPLLELRYQDTVSNHTHIDSLQLTNSQSELLHLDEVVSIENMDQLGIAHRLNISDDYTSIIFRYCTSEKELHSVLVNYDDAFHIISHLELAFYKVLDKAENNHDDKIRTKWTFVTHKDLTISERTAFNRHSQKRFLFSKSGEILLFDYHKLAELEKKSNLITTRIVNAESGLNIRDANGKKIGKIDHGNMVFIIGYSDDTLTIKDNGKLITGRKAEIILDYNKFRESLLVPSDEPNSGFVFEGYLLNNPGGHDSSGLSDEDSYNEYYLENQAIRIGAHYHFDELIEVRDLLSIEKVDYSIYEKNIKLSESRAYSINDWGAIPNTDITELKFNDGTQRTLRDTVIIGEYDYIQDFSLYEERVYPNSYLIFSSFFEEYNFCLLNKQQGDTLSIFEDYPFFSPKKTTAVCLKTLWYDPYVLILEFNRIEGGDFKPHKSVFFTNWNVNEEKTIYWLSETEFIVKAAEYAEDGRENDYEASFGETIYLKISLE